MSSDSMGNLEKLGILVIVILVVVVGVVAITPSDTLFGPEGASSGDTADLPPHPDDVAPLELSEKAAARSAPREVAQVPELPVLPPWPVDDESGKRRDVSSDPSPLPPRSAVEPSPPVEPEPPKVAVPEPVRETPRFQEITVRKGDNLWRIAERELGDGGKWKVLAAANPSIDPDRLQAGQKLRVPLAGSATEEAAAGSDTRSPVARDARSYTVQRGDTPMGLSQRFYGSVKHHRMLLSHNGIDDARGLMAGMEIEVPPAPTTSSNIAPLRESSSSSSAAAPPPGRSYDVRSGETLADIAREQLGKESRWREIAKLNGIDDPRTLRAGARIRLPE